MSHKIHGLEYVVQIYGGQFYIRILHDNGIDHSFLTQNGTWGPPWAIYYRRTREDALEFAAQFHDEPPMTSEERLMLEQIYGWED